MPAETNVTAALWAAGGALVVAVFNQVTTFWKERAHRRDEHQRERTRTALTVAVALESFALACSNCLQDIGIAEAEASAQCDESLLRGVKLPAFVMPNEPDWRWIGANLADAILVLQLKVEHSRLFIRANAEYDASAFDTTANIATHARRRGARAWELATQLRRECKLPAHDFTGEEWDFTQLLFPEKAVDDDRPVDSTKSQKE